MLSSNVWSLELDDYMIMYDYGGRCIVVAGMIILELLWNLEIVEFYLMGRKKWTFYEIVNWCCTCLLVW